MLWIQLQATIAVVVGTGVANRVLYKLALVPMGGEGCMSSSLLPKWLVPCSLLYAVAADYVFVLSQFQTFGYVLVYASLLASRFR